MKHFMAACIAAFLSTGTAFGQSPLGEWLVKDRTAQIRIVNCGGTVWGVISWTKGPPGRDENNPNPAKRNRSVLGMPILINMQSNGNQWEGEVYNAQDGSTYTSHIKLVSPDVLSIEGCVFGGLFCGGENWTRVPLSKDSPSDQAVCSRLPK
jgi:uncharacterized protein (DUF2147 family)